MATTHMIAIKSIYLSPKSELIVVGRGEKWGLDAGSFAGEIFVFLFLLFKQRFQPLWRVKMCISTKQGESEY